MPTITITCKTHGFRRLGRAWAQGKTVIDASEYTEDELQTLIDDPMFDVRAGADEAAPLSADDKVEQLIAAIAQLEPGNAEHWTKSGKPEIKALEALCGFNINAKLRDAAWAKVQG